MCMSHLVHLTYRVGPRSWRRTPNAIHITSPRSRLIGAFPVNYFVKQLTKTLRGYHDPVRRPSNVAIAGSRYLDET